MQSRGDSADRDTEQVGNLVQRQVEVVVQHHHRAMIDGKPPEATFQLVAVRDGRDPVPNRLIGRQQAELRRHPAALPTPLGVAGAHEEAVRPGVKARRVAQLRKVPPDGEQRLLRRVLGELDIGQVVAVACDVRRFDPERGGEVVLEVGRYDPDVLTEGVELKARNGYLYLEGLLVTTAP